jgi:hypothetical protein
MARRRESLQELNPYGSLEDFDRQKTISPPVEDLIDLSSVISRSSTPGPSANHHAALNNASPNL